MSRVSDIITELETENKGDHLEKKLIEMRTILTYNVPPIPVDAFYLTIECIRKRFWSRKPKAYLPFW